MTGPLLAVLDAGHHRLCDMAENRLPLVHIPVGLPGCGKTRWAREKIRAHLDAGGAPESLIRLSRDDLRAMLTVRYRKPVRGFEEPLTVALNAMLASWIESGADVIVDAVNLDPLRRGDLTSLVERCGARWELADFRDVPLETCIARDAQRTGSAHVGEQVIRDLHARYLAPQQS